MALIQPIPGMSLARKKERKEYDITPRQRLVQLKLFPSTLPKYWEVISIEKRKRET